MGPYGRQTFKMLLLPQISFESFQTFSEISSQWSSQKYCFGFLKFWVFDFSGILFVFVNIGPKWERKLQNATLPSNHFWILSNFSEFYSQWSWPKYCFGFLKFSVFHFSGIWDPMGANASKCYSSLKSLLNLFNLFLNFLLSCPHKSTVLDFWNFKFPIFNEFLNFTIAPYGETKHLNYLENERP